MNAAARRGVAMPFWPCRALEGFGAAWQRLARLINNFCSLWVTLSAAASQSVRQWFSSEMGASRDLISQIFKVLSRSNCCSFLYLLRYLTEYLQL